MFNDGSRIVVKLRHILKSCYSKLIHPLVTAADTEQDPYEKNADESADENSNEEEDDANQLSSDENPEEDSDSSEDEEPQEISEENLDTIEEDQDQDPSPTKQGMCNFSMSDCHCLTTILVFLVFDNILHIFIV